MNEPPSAPHSACFMIFDIGTILLKGPGKSHGDDFGSVCSVKHVAAATKCTLAARAAVGMSPSEQKLKACKHHEGNTLYLYFIMELICKILLFSSFIYFIFCSIVMDLEGPIC